MSANVRWARLETVPSDPAPGTEKDALHQRLRDWPTLNDHNDTTGNSHCDICSTRLPCDWSLAIADMHEAAHRIEHLERSSGVEVLSASMMTPREAAARIMADDIDIAEAGLGDIREHGGLPEMFAAETGTDFRAETVRVGALFLVEEYPRNGRLYLTGPFASAAAAIDYQSNQEDPHWKIEAIVRVTDSACNHDPHAVTNSLCECGAEVAST